MGDSDSTLAQQTTTKIVNETKTSDYFTRSVWYDGCVRNADVVGIRGTPRDNALHNRLPSYNIFPSARNVNFQSFIQLVSFYVFCLSMNLFNWPQRNQQSEWFKWGRPCRPTVTMVAEYKGKKRVRKNKKSVEFQFENSSKLNHSILCGWVCLLYDAEWQNSWRFVFVFLFCLEIEASTFAAKKVALIAMWYHFMDRGGHFRYISINLTS